MSRRLALALLGVMLAMVVGQGLRLWQMPSRPVQQVLLHESRLLAFLQEVREHSPATYDSTVLNLVRLRDAQARGQNVLPEEAAVAEQLLARLTGAAPGGAASAAAGR